MLHLTFSPPLKLCAGKVINGMGQMSQHLNECLVTRQPLADRPETNYDQFIMDKQTQIVKISQHILLPKAPHHIFFHGTGKCFHVKRYCHVISHDKETNLH